MFIAIHFIAARFKEIFCWFPKDDGIIAPKHVGAM
jgi:hypothetical protein